MVGINKCNTHITEKYMILDLEAFRRKKKQKEKKFSSGTEVSELISDEETTEQIYKPDWLGFEQMTESQQIYYRAIILQVVKKGGADLNARLMRARWTRDHCISIVPTS